MPFQLNDTIEVRSPRKTADGYLVADARVARAGIQIYRGSELGRPDMDTVRVYRPEDEVFTQNAVKTYAHRPVTLGHPIEPVTADNWRDVAVGSTGDPIVRDGDFVRVPLVLMDAKAIVEVEAGIKQLSMGYSANIEFLDGVTQSGEPYDAIQKDLVMNHLAVVPAARGGSELRIGDKHKEQAMPETRKVVVDGLTIETTVQGAEVIDRLQKRISDSEASRKTAIDAKDRELAAKDAEIAELNKKVLDDAAINALVVKRAEMFGKVRKVLGDKHADVTKVKTEADMRRMVVAAKLGDAAVMDKSDAYVEVRFDDLVSDAEKRVYRNADPVVSAVRDSGGSVIDMNDHGWGAAIAARGLAKKEA